MTKRISSIKYTFAAAAVLCAALFTVLFSSCRYTPIEDDEPVRVFGYVRGTVDGKENQPVPFIVVQMLSNEESSPNRFIQMTDYMGYFEFEGVPQESYTVLFTDTDGEKNGKFKQKETGLTVTNKDHTFGFVNLVTETAD